jgi:thiamine-phosphate pyrophosphorylase
MGTEGSLVQSGDGRAVLRLIDANANRASEGLRVLEDFARFVLCSARLSQECKQLRHALRAALTPVDGAAALLRARDTESDVGTGSVRGAQRVASEVAASERRREGPVDVARAEAARVGEALRALEEACKLVDGGANASEACKGLRYRAYDAGRDIVLALLSKPPRWQPALCVLLTERLCTHMPWQRVAQQAIAGGADCLQLREKDLSTRELLARARELVELARPHPQVRVVVNDRVDVALAAQAHGVHLGQSDMPAHEARMLAARCGQQLLVGVSTFSAEEAHEAAEAGADMCGVGPMFATATKHKPVLAGPAALARYLADPVTALLPHLAIGGIEPGNVGQLRAVGCRGIAVSGAVCGSSDPAGVCRALGVG